MRKLPLILLLTLTACGNLGYGWYKGSLARNKVDVDGVIVTVLDSGDGQYDAFDGGNPRYDSVFTIKQRQIAGIEKFSGCKVTDAEYMQGAPILQTKVKC